MSQKKKIGVTSRFLGGKSIEPTIQIQWLGNLLSRARRFRFNPNGFFLSTSPYTLRNQSVGQFFVALHCLS